MMSSYDSDKLVYEQYKDADSMLLLRHVYDKIQAEGYKINNIDSNIIAQSPKMMPYIPKMI